MATKTKTTLLIDGDILLYSEAASVEDVYDWGDDIWTVTGDARLAQQSVDVCIAKYKEILEADDVIITLTGQENWRKDLLPTYKHNRKGKRKPVVFPALRDYCKKVYKTVCYENLEADDVMGLYATGFKGNLGKTIVVSEDKDLKTIPGQLYNPNKPEDGILCISQEEADLNHLTQALTGDSTDGYSGCPGVGPKTAEKILKMGTWEEVMGAYLNAGLSEQDALIQARVARILRKGEFKAKTQEVKLWNPE